MHILQFMRTLSLHVAIIDTDEKLSNVLIDILEAIPHFEVEVSIKQYVDTESLVDFKFDVYLITEKYFDVLRDSNWGETVPVIIIGGGKYEDVAIESGAANYIRTHELNKAKLSKSIRYAIERYELRKQTREAHLKREEELQQLITQQNKLIEGIRYAKLIQDALLIDRENLLDMFGEFMIVYKPRDIVSGDFYFAMERHGQKYLAVADCTGHGVPGAFMSIMCNDLLRRAVKKFVEPKDILSYVAKVLNKEFRKNEESMIADGMDIALIKVDGKKITFSGAYRPLIYSSGESVNYIRGDKITLGVNASYEESKFTQKEIELQSGDRVYLFSDGVVDQFGGDTGVKFSRKRFIEWLEEHANMPIGEQEKAFTKRIGTWMGKEDQIDDMLVLGVEL